MCLKTGWDQGGSSREFLEILESNGQLERLSRTVDPLDVSSIIAGSEHAVLIPVKGFSMPVVGGIVRDRGKTALALGCEPAALSEKVLHALQTLSSRYWWRMHPARMSWSPVVT